MQFLAVFGLVRGDLEAAGRGALRRLLMTSVPSLTPAWSACDAFFGSSMGPTLLPTPYAVPKVAASAAAKAVTFTPVFMAAPVRR